MGTVEQVMMATVVMDAVVDFATANAQTLIIMYCMVSMSILAWNEYSLRKTEESKANVQDKPLAAAEQPLTTCGSTTGTGAGHGAGDDEDEGEEEAFNGVGSFLTDIPTDVKEKMLQWHKLTFVRSRKQVCCEQALQVFNAAVKLFDLVRKVLLFVPPVGPMIKNVIDSIVNAPILADVLAFIQWLVLSAITMSPAVYQIIGTDKNGKLVSVLYIYEMSGCYVRMFNNPQKRAAKLIAKTEDGRVAFEFGVKQSCCGMCPPYGSIRTCGEKKEKVCHTAKPQKGGCFAVCAPREIGRVKITKKLKDGEGNEPKPLRVIQSRFCPMSCGSSIPFYKDIKLAKNGKCNEVFFMLPNGFIEFAKSLCGEMPIPGGLPALPAPPAPPMAAELAKYQQQVDPEKANGETTEEKEEDKAEGKKKLVNISNCHVSFGDQDQPEIVQFCNRLQILNLMLFNDYMELGCKMNSST